MGIIGDALKARRMRDPVDRTARVVGSMQPPDSATSGNVDLMLVVQAEGVRATSVEHSRFAPTKKWPYPLRHSRSPSAEPIRAGSGSERLARLKESGVLTEQELEREKARIVGEG